MPWYRRREGTMCYEAVYDSWPISDEDLTRISIEGHNYMLFIPPQALGAPEDRLFTWEINVVLGQQLFPRLNSVAS